MEREAAAAEDDLEEELQVIFNDDLNVDNRNDDGTDCTGADDNRKVKWAGSLVSFALHLFAGSLQMDLTPE